MPKWFVYTRSGCRAAASGAFAISGEYITWAILCYKLPWCNSYCTYHINDIMPCRIGSGRVKELLSLSVCCRRSVRTTQVGVLLTFRWQYWLRSISCLVFSSPAVWCWYKLAFHDADTDILARIVARISACRSSCHRNNFNRAFRTCRRGIGSSRGSRCRYRGMRHRHQLPREDSRGDVGEENRLHFTTPTSSPTYSRGSSRECRRVAQLAIGITRKNK